MPMEEEEEEAEEEEEEEEEEECRGGKNWYCRVQLLWILNKTTSGARHSIR